MHLQTESVVPHNNKGSEGSGKTEYIAAQDDLAQRAALADGADEERNSHAPYHPVGPVENGPGLREGGGPEGIRPGGKTDKVLGHIAQGGDAFFNDEAGLATEKEYISQETEEQPGTGCCGELHAFHAKVDAEGIDRAYDNQNDQGQAGALRNAGHIADGTCQKRCRQGEGCGGSGEEREDCDQVDQLSGPAIHTVSQNRTAGFGVFLAGAFADMEHEAERCGQHQIKAPRDRSPVEQRVSGSPLMYRSHFRCMRI